MHLNQRKYNRTIRYKLLENCSIYTAEAIAILKIIKHIYIYDPENTFKKNIIHTNLLSTLKSIQNKTKTIDIHKKTIETRKTSYTYHSFGY